MKDENYLKANNARSLWHPMASPKDNQSNPPAIIVGGSGARVVDINQNEVVDAIIELAEELRDFSRPTEWAGRPLPRVGQTA